MLNPRPPAAAEIHSTNLIMPEHATPAGYLRAGLLMEWVDYAAGMTAIRHCRATCVTRYMDRMAFDHPIRVGDAIHLHSRPTWTGRSSIEITVDIWRENLGSGEVRLANTARLVFVMVGADLKPLKAMPPLLLTSPEEQAAFAAAEQRLQARRHPPADDFDFTPQVRRTEVVMPGDRNPHGTLAGGKLMDWMDYAASLAALRHARTAVAPRSVDDLNFDLPIRVGDAVHIGAAVTWTGRTSMEVAVEVVKETLLTGEKARTHTAYFTFVAVDPEDGYRPVPVRPFVASTPAEAARMERAAARQAARRAGRSTDPTRPGQPG